MKTIDIKENDKKYDKFRDISNYRGKLLSIDTNAKTVKGQKFGYMTAILYLAPAALSEVIDVCSMASAGCKKVCLNTAGRGRFDNVQQARINKTLYFYFDQAGFMARLK